MRPPLLLFQFFFNFFNDEIGNVKHRATDEKNKLVVGNLAFEKLNRSKRTLRHSREYSKAVVKIHCLEGSLWRSVTEHSDKYELIKPINCVERFLV